MILRLFALVFFALFARATGAVSKTVILAEGSRVSGEPDAATWTSFSEACIDKGGGLVACANTSRDWRIIYKALGGEVVTRVATGQSIPVQDGASSDTLNFPQWQSPVRATSQGRFVMYARLLRTPAGSNDQGWNAIVYGDGAGLRLVARIGDPMPGTGEPIAAFSRSVQLDPQGKVILARAPRTTRLR